VLFCEVPAVTAGGGFPVYSVSEIDGEEGASNACEGEDGHVGRFVASGPCVRWRVQCFG